MNTPRALFCALLLPLLCSLPATAAPPPGSSSSDVTRPDRASPVLAQRGEGRMGKQGRRGRLSPEERKKLEEEVQRKMHTYVTVELASRLGLDDKAALQLSSAVKAHGEKQRAARTKLREEYRVLEQLLESKASPEQLKKQTQVVLDASSRRGDIEELAAETAKFLTAEQQARLVIAAPQVMREMRHMMKRAKRGGRGARGGQGAATGPQAP